MSEESEKVRRAYNTAAIRYRMRYSNIPPRQEDVDLALEYVPSQDPFVVEIGCAYGREARYVLTRTTRYLGIDISDEYIEMARAEIPHGKFVRADALEFEFPTGIDAVFAFASLLHVPKGDMWTVLQRLSTALKSNGVIFLSLKRGDRYWSEVVDDELVSRRFYYYTRTTIQELRPPELREVYYAEQDRSEPWFTMILQKQ